MPRRAVPLPPADFSTPSAQQKQDDRYVAALSVDGGQQFCGGLCGAGGDPGRLLPAGRRGHDMYRANIYARSAGGRTGIQLAGP